MVSAERVISYGHLLPEAPLETHPLDQKPPPEWPKNGQLEVRDLTYRHSQDGPVVLKGLSFTAKPGEKV